MAAGGRGFAGARPTCYFSRRTEKRRELAAFIGHSHSIRGETEGRLPMSKMHFTVNGMPLFTWLGDAAAVAEVLDTFPKIVRDVGLSPDAFADGCVALLKGGKLLCEEKA